MNNEQDSKMLLDLANASQRLRATQDKASDVQSWIIKPYRLAEAAMSFTETDGLYFNDTHDYKPHPFRSGRAYGLRPEVLTEYEQARMDTPASAEREQSAALPAAAKTTAAKNTAEKEDHQLLFAVIDEKQPGMGKILSTANENAEEYDFTKEEKGLLFNALQYQTVRDFIIESLQDPGFCLKDPGRAASYRRVRAVLDGENELGVKSQVSGYRL